MSYGEYPTDQYEQQPDASLSQANPVSTTWYTVLDTVKNARITSIYAMITWATTQPTPLEVRVTIDGKTLVFAITNPVTATVYLASITPNSSDAFQGLVATYTTAGSTWPGLIPLALEGRSVKVEVRITWATTQPTPLVCRVKYAKR